MVTVVMTVSVVVVAADMEATVLARVGVPTKESSDFKAVCSAGRRLLDRFLSWDVRLGESCIYK